MLSAASCFEVLHPRIVTGHCPRLQLDEIALGVDLPIRLRCLARRSSFKQQNLSQNLRMPKIESRVIPVQNQSPNPSTLQRQAQALNSPHSGCLVLASVLVFRCESQARAGVRLLTFASSLGERRGSMLRAFWLQDNLAGGLPGRLDELEKGIQKTCTEARTLQHGTRFPLNCVISFVT